MIKWCWTTQQQENTGEDLNNDEELEQEPPVPLTSSTPQRLSASTNNDDIDTSTIPSTPMTNASRRSSRNVDNNSVIPSTPAARFQFQLAESSDEDITWIKLRWYVVHLSIIQKLKYIIKNWLSTSDRNQSKKKSVFSQIDQVGVLTEGWVGTKIVYMPIFWNTQMKKDEGGSRIFQQNGS